MFNLESMCKCNMDIQSGICIQIAAGKDRLSIFFFSHFVYNCYAFNAERCYSDIMFQVYTGKSKAGQTLVPVDFILR